MREDLDRRDAAAMAATHVSYSPATTATQARAMDEDVILPASRKELRHQRRDATVETVQAKLREPLRHLVHC
jgi:hypothetical protein